MLILGVSGGWDEAHAPVDPLQYLRLDIFNSHDSAAVLLRDGEVIAAIEEERLSRAKHSGHFPAHAIRFCCDEAGVELGAVDVIACCAEERGYDLVITNQSMRKPEVRSRHFNSRSYIAAALAREFGPVVKNQQLRFVDHHLCHAMSVYGLCEQESALVVTLDGEGDGRAGSIYSGVAGRLEPLASIPIKDSLGTFYLRLTQLLGFRAFGEFKVMGLAPYGDPARFRALFEQLLTLEPDGRFTVRYDRLPMILQVVVPRGSQEPIEGVHHDLAAALQERLERVCLHMLKHFRALTRHRTLCLSGGVAQNCAMNGVIERSGLFDNVVVGPASGDAGCAMGAAAFTHAQQSSRRQARSGFTLPSVYLGTRISSTNARDLLSGWSPLIQFRTSDDVVEEAADLLQAGEVLGWAQGRSEFGPRALGNRSILADPRPAANRDRVNLMVKKRESFRPFAPSVPMECSHEYFEVREGARYPYMSFVVRVKREYQSILGAVTHIDGSARLQTVERTSNEKYWRLLHAFAARTGIPILLNTSFNNNHEPIVDSLDDCVACYLTTGIDSLIIDELVVSRRSQWQAGLLELGISIPEHLQLREVTQYAGHARGRVTHHVLTNYNLGIFHPRSHAALSPDMYRCLRSADGRRTVGDLFGAIDPMLHPGLLDELSTLWSQRLVRLAPVRPS
jgi:carbamoyltransferase